MADRSDQYHLAATQILRALVARRARFVTTNVVRGETLTWLTRTHGLGHAAAVRFAEWLDARALRVDENTHRFAGWTLVIVSAETEALAHEIFVRHDRSRLSYADCVSFATMRRTGIQTALAFDQHFAELGFALASAE